MFAPTSVFLKLFTITASLGGLGYYILPNQFTRQGFLGLFFLTV
jgi:hypothetical protein